MYSRSTAQCLRWDRPPHAHSISSKRRNSERSPSMTSSSRFRKRRACARRSSENSNSSASAEYPCRAGCLTWISMRIDSSGWMESRIQLGRSSRAGFTEQLLRRMAEADRDHRGLVRHALAGAQIERHPTPAPVVDVELGSDEGFGGWNSARRFLPAGSHHGLASIVPRVYCARSACACTARLAIDGSSAAPSPFRPAARRLRARGRLHRDDGEQLHQVVLQHVAQRAGAIVVVGTILDADRLGHVICTWSMKLRFHKGSISVLAKRKPAGSARLLAEKVIDAVDLLLVEMLMQQAIEHLRDSRSSPKAFRSRRGSGRAAC